VAECSTPQKNSEDEKGHSDNDSDCDSYDPAHTRILIRLMASHIWASRSCRHIVPSGEHQSNDRLDYDADDSGGEQDCPQAEERDEWVVTADEKNPTPVMTIHVQMTMSPLVFRLLMVSPSCKHLRRTRARPDGRC
jgi:hypothetical protein